MTSTPTPEEFLAAPSDPDDAEDLELRQFEAAAESRYRAMVGDVEQHSCDPLESIAASLGLIAASVVRQGNEEREQSEQAELFDETRAERDDWEDKHRAAVDLIHEIETIVKPSTSKVSLEVKAAVERWSNPVVETVAHAAENVVNSVDFNGNALVQPAHDAPVQEWRDYAYNAGLSAPDVDSANRSQIRTMLGVEQPVGSP